MSETVEKPEDITTKKGGRILKIVSAPEEDSDNNDLRNEYLAKLNDFYSEFSNFQLEVTRANAIATQCLSWIDRLVSMLIEKEVITKDDLYKAMVQDMIDPDMLETMERESSNGVIYPMDDPSNEEPPLII